MQAHLLDRPQFARKGRRLTAAGVAAWRERLGLSQRAAAAALGMSLSGYQQIERGLSWRDGPMPAPSRRTALAMAAIEAGVAAAVDD